MPDLTKNRFQEIKGQVLAQNPDLKITDEQLRAAVNEAVEKISAKAENPQTNSTAIQNPQRPSESSLTKNQHDVLIESHEPKEIDPKELMAAILDSLHGNSNKFGTTDPDLAKNVKEFLGL